MSDLVWTAWRPGATYSGGGINMHGNPPKYRRHVVMFWPSTASGATRLTPVVLCHSTDIGEKFDVRPLPQSDVTCRLCQAEWRKKDQFTRQAMASTRHLRKDPSVIQFREQLADNTPESVLAFADWLEERADPTAKFLRVIAMADLDWKSAVRPQFKVTT